MSRWALVKAADLEAAIFTLESDGDEHGVAEKLRTMLRQSQFRTLADFEAHQRSTGPSDALTCPHPGCTQTDGKPCAYAECPNRGADR